MASAAEQQIFKSLNGLTFLMGLLVGLALVIMGVLFLDIAPNSSGVVKFVSPQVEGPLMFFLFGATQVVQWARQRLQAQLQAIWQPTTHRTPLSLYPPINGVLFTSLGIFLLIDRAFDYSLYVILLLLFAEWLVASLWAFWYAWRRDKRLKAQP